MANSGGREKKSCYSYSRISSRFRLILSRLGRGWGDDGVRGSVRHFSSSSGPSWLQSEGDTASWRCQGRTPVPCPSFPSVRVELFSRSIRRDSEKTWRSQDALYGENRPRTHQLMLKSMWWIMDIEFGIQTPGWPLPRHVTLQLLKSSSVPLFPICKMGVRIIAPSSLESCED